METDEKVFASTVLQLPWYRNRCIVKWIQYSELQKWFQQAF